MPDKRSGQVLTVSGQIGTAGNPGYLNGVTILRSGGAGSAIFYDGSDTTGTERYRMTVADVAGDSKSSPAMSLWFSSGCYCALTNAIVSVEYSGF